MRYEPKLSGSTTGAKTGRHYRYDVGKLIEAPQGEFEHLGNRMIKRGDVKTAVLVESDKRYPIHTGAGYYELSNGEKVRGKSKAIKAQKELDA